MRSSSLDSLFKYLVSVSAKAFGGVFLVLPSQEMSLDLSAMLTSSYFSGKVVLLTIFHEI